MMNKKEKIKLAAAGGLLTLALWSNPLLVLAVGALALPCAYYYHQSKE